MCVGVLSVPLFCHKPGVLAQKMVKSVVPEMERSQYDELDIQG